MFTRLLNCLLPTNYVEVRFTDTKSFKITITADGEIRIKVPKCTSNSTVRAIEYGARQIANQPLVRSYQYTLRAKFKHIDGDMTLRSGDSKKPSLRVSKYKVSEINSRCQYAASIHT